MSRFFAPISTDELCHKVLAAFSESSEEGIHPYLLKEKLGKDLKVDFDCENFSTRPREFGPSGLTGLVALGNGLTFWGMCAGGDWEHPVFWIVYWDGKKLRGYVPTEGNPWNTRTKRAYGNDDEADLKDARRRWPERFAGADYLEPSDFDFDPGLILEDVLERIQPKP